jgi:cell wall-associated NlpC family hydrolase
MKNFRRCVFIASLLFLPIIQVYASDRSSNKIFPSYIGISGKIVGQDINIRKYPDIYANIVKQVDASAVKVIGQNNEWYKIAMGSGEGWVYKQYVQVARPELVPYSKILGEEIVDYGKQFIGTPYRWGGNDLKRGVDCSGLTKEIYKTFDIDISRVSYMQVKDGKRIPRSDLMPGDLVFFDTSGKNRGNISHVGIYAGANRFLHADGQRGVMISSLTSPYYKRNYVAGARVIKT